MAQTSPAPRSTAATAWIFLQAIVRELRWGLLGAACLSILFALSEGFGVLLLLPLLQTLELAPSDSAGSGIAETVARGLTALGLTASLGSVVAVFIVVSCARAALERANLTYQPILELRFAIALRERLHRAIARSEWSFFVTQRSSDLLHALTREVDRSSTSARQILSFGTGALVSAAYVAVALRLSPILTLLVAAIGGTLLWASRWQARQSGHLGQRHIDADRDLFHVSSESIAGLKVAKIVGAQDRDSTRFVQHDRGRAAAYLALLRSYSGAKLGLDVASALVLGGLLVVAVWWLNLRGAGLLVLIFVFARVMPRVVALQNAAQIIVGGLPSFDAVQRLIDSAEAHQEPVAAEPKQLPRGGDIQLLDVSFSYAGASTAALNHVSLRIPAGRTTAIVGASGAGKSTLADILIGLLVPAQGQVLVGGQPLRQADLAGWRRSVGYVPQDGFLLDDTIRANFLWAVPEATEAQMWQALSRAAAADFVRSRPEGLATTVGDRGIRLSGGERQRLALARALLSDQDILVLDEATSALDSVNERQILQAVRALDRQVTTVIITHRLAAIRDADHIHVLHDGRIVESGTWEELLARQGRFVELLHAQTDRSTEPDLCEQGVAP